MRLVEKLFLFVIQFSCIIVILCKIDMEMMQDVYF